MPNRRHSARDNRLPVHCRRLASRRHRAAIPVATQMSRTPQSAHHPHKSHDEHRQCNPGGGIHFAVLLGSDNSYTTPSEIPFFDPKSFVVAVYGWWSPNVVTRCLLTPCLNVAKKQWLCLFVALVVLEGLLGEGHLGLRAPYSDKHRGRETRSLTHELSLRNARLFIILFVRNFWRVCSQFWLSVRNSV